MSEPGVAIEDPCAVVARHTKRAVIGFLNAAREPAPTLIAAGAESTIVSRDAAREAWVRMIDRLLVDLA